MRFFLIAGMATVLLGGGAAGVYFFLSQPAEASLSAMSEVEKAEAEAAKAAHETPVQQAIFVELDPIILPIVDDNGVSQVVSMVISVEVTDENAAISVRTMQPRLKDAFIQDMYGMLNRKALSSGGLIEVSTIKARLNNISHKVMGENVVKGVLLQVVKQRKV